MALFCFINVVRLRAPERSVLPASHVFVLPLWREMLPPREVYNQNISTSPIAFFLTKNQLHKFCKYKVKNKMIVRK